MEIVNERDISKIRWIGRLETKETKKQSRKQRQDKHEVCYEMICAKGKVWKRSGSCPSDEGSKWKSDGVPEDGERARDENLRRKFFQNKKILFWRIVERIFEGK